METVAIVDIGSNTVKLAVYKVDFKKKKFKQIFKESAYIRLLDCVDNDGYLTEEGFIKARVALESFKDRLFYFKPSCVIAFGTYVLRVIKNREQFLSKMADLFEIEVLSGKEEAYYSTLGALLDIKQKCFLTFDIGGGSLEVCKIKDRQIKCCKSYPLGTLEFKDCVDGNSYNILCVEEKVEKYVKKDKNIFGESEKLVGIGGSIRAIKKITGKRKIKKKLLKQIIKEIQETSPIRLTEKYKIPIERTKTVLVAAVVGLKLMNIFKSKELLISKYSIREGILYEKVVKNGENGRSCQSKTSNKQGVELA
ncbi:hypothetical protein [Desulfurobacterium atlanticum]|uniref:Exopolyphosphatase / guanosine-5'-triphosphate,3'-diphosphate pyrophosphatase n=1 Tax=Desulfurobacterium atlanticum TaxID=240169 RepID=A0A238YJJ0_9BACT|nr:hypothetical protein [Desulfurobacterium atlanticum]SNR71297.1 exopolyphosphatase / guanosine-5'-triphosphate,3'-diphosphate pyrophosphatase [Desulfurobacterium atlanticum]